MLNAPFFYALRQVDWKLLTIVASKNNLLWDIQGIQKKLIKISNPI